MNYIDQACIITKVTKSQFIDTLMADEYASWRYEDCEALFDYYEDMSLDQGAPIELDRVAIRGEWSTASNFEQVMEEYDYIRSMEDLVDSSYAVIEHDDGSILYQPTYPVETGVSLSQGVALTDETIGNS